MLRIEKYTHFEVHYIYCNISIIKGLFIMRYTILKDSFLALYQKNMVLNSLGLWEFVMFGFILKDRHQWSAAILEKG